MCASTNEPIFITKNGYGDMVIMSMKAYEEKMYMLDVYARLSEAESQAKEGKVLDADEALKGLRSKYNV
jgi:PHD/YefM family antitoxin component YafN of YafNO toxin-antitoxin module